VKVKDNPSGDFKSMYRHISKGSWTFSDQDHGWQVSDCTAEGLKVTYTNFAQKLHVSYSNLIHLILSVISPFFSPSSPPQCCLLLSMMPPEIVGEKMEPERLDDFGDLLLSLQVLA
jgi:hypothetical protein